MEMRIAKCEVRSGNPRSEAVVMDLIFYLNSSPMLPLEKETQEQVARCLREIDELKKRGDWTQPAKVTMIPFDYKITGTSIAELREAIRTRSKARFLIIRDREMSRGRALGDACSIAWKECLSL